MATVRAQARLGSRLSDFRELALLWIVLVGYLAAYESPEIQNNYWMNLAGPIGIILILSLGSWWQLKREPLSIWMPLFWFRIATATYFGVGAIAPYIANDETLVFIKSLYSFSEQEALKVGLVNIVCIWTVLGVATFFRIPPIAVLGGRIISPQSWTIRFAAIFLMAGGFVRYLIVLPASFGLLDNVPGVIMPLGKSYVVGLFLLVLAGLRGNRAAKVCAIILLPIDLAVGLLTFAKTEVMLTLIVTFLAFLHGRITITRIMLGLTIIFGIYSQLDPIVHYGRAKGWRQFRDAPISLSNRVELLRSYTDQQALPFELANRQTALSRLCYLNAAAMVIRYFDTGEPGWSMANAFIVVIPRFIWPNKPEITSVGKELYTRATQYDGSSISPGLFSEAYWNFGWLGLPILMIPLGVILSLFSRYSIGVMRREAWLHLPAVLLGVSVGVRVDGWYVADIIGASATALVYATLFFFIERHAGQQPANAWRK